MTNKISFDKQKDLFKKYGKKNSMIDSNNNIASFKSEIRRSLSTKQSQVVTSLSYKRNTYRKSVSNDH